MKDFLKITREELDLMKSKGIKVYEKLDMTYFKVFVLEDGVSIFSSKGNRLTKVDFMINSINRGIRDFVNNVIEGRKDEIIERFGECKIGFFYLPVHKTKSVDYYRMDEGTFILSDLFTSDKSKNDVYGMLSFLNGKNGEKVSFSEGNILPPPFITEYDGLTDDDIEKILDLSSSNETLKLADMMSGSNTYTGLKVSEIEGLVISCGKYKYQIIVNRSEINDDMSVRKIYRDTVLENFASVMNEFDFDHILDSDKSPELKVCDLFLEYMDRTNLFFKTYIENEDLLPPHDGYIGDIDWDVLPSTVRLVCKNDEKYKNILRILFSILLCRKIETKTKDFNQSTKEILEKINLSLRRKDK